MNFNNISARGAERRFFLPDSSVSCKSASNKPNFIDFGSEHPEELLYIVEKKMIIKNKACLVHVLIEDATSNSREKKRRKLGVGNPASSRRLPRSTTGGTRGPRDFPRFRSTDSMVTRCPFANSVSIYLWLV